MKRIILCLSLFAFFGSQAQQINPVPDYVFRNQMSVGRNAVTDTAAYMSIGPRYGANKGLMPPIVSDTAAITGVKRNGLLIFSVQRNNFQYWDSINSRWTSVTANVDTTVISTRAWRKKGDDSLGAVIATRTDTTLLSTRAWRQKGLDSLAAIEIDGSGTVNYVPKFTATRTLGNSQIFDNGTNVGIGTTSPALKLHVEGGMRVRNASGHILEYTNDILYNYGGSGNYWQYINGADYVLANRTATGALTFGTNSTERLRIFANGRVGINTTTDAGYQFDVAGSMRNTTGANFATSSGNVSIGTTLTPTKFNVLSTSYTIANFKSSQYFGNVNYHAIVVGDLVGSKGAQIGYAEDTSNSANSFAYITPFGFAEGAQIRITNAGNTGLGLTSQPTERLDVNGRIRARTIDSTSSPINVLTSDVNGVIRKTAPGVLGSGTTNYVAKFTASGTVGNSQIFDNGSNIGYGTTSPNVTLHVFRNQPLLWLETSESNRTIGGFQALNTDVRFVSTYNTGGTSFVPITFYNGGSERLRVTPDGELLINTTTDVGDYRLQVNGNANFRDDVLIDTNLRVNRHISLDQTPKSWALGNAIEGPQGSTLFVAGGGVQTLANIYYDGSYKYSTSNPGAAMFLLQSGITFATYGSGTANGALTGANEMVYAGGELRVGIADQGTFKLQVADKSYFGDEVQIASTTDLGNYKLQVTGEAIITAGIRTDAPSGGTAATWKLGTVATVSPTSPNRTIEVEIGGTTYYIHAKTTNN